MGHKKIPFDSVYSQILHNLSLWKTSSYFHESVLEHFIDEIINIEDLITRTFTMGESNSLLLIGPRGSGKTTVIKVILDKLTANEILSEGFVVKLNGLLHTDDRLALREIMRQLSIDGEDCPLGSFSENLNFILKTLQSGNRETSKPVLFLLDEFDLFCHHRNQTLLYNLFDISQSAQAPICVIGLTSRLDVIELLEKRVKSRFSHRQIFLYPKEKFEDFYLVAQNLLKVEAKIIGEKKPVSTWNKSIDNIFKDSEVNQILKQVFCLNKDIRNLKSFLHHLVLNNGDENQFLTVLHFKNALRTFSEDSKRRVLDSVSILQLCLLITMKRLNQIYDGEPFNFEMVFRQYKKFGEKFSSMCSYERPVVFKAFDELENLELIRPVDSSRSCIQREYRLMHLLLLPNHIDETINSRPNIPTFLSYWNSSNES